MVKMNKKWRAPATSSGHGTGWGEGSGRDEEVPARAGARRCGGEEEAERTEEAPTGGALQLLPSLHR